VNQDRRVVPAPSRCNAQPFGRSPFDLQACLVRSSTLGGLAPTRYISTRVQLAIFLYICKEGLGVRHAGEAFQRSLDTVSKWVIPSIPMLTLSSFKAVVQAFTCPTYYYHWVRMPTYSIPHPPTSSRTPSSILGSKTAWALWTVLSFPSILGLNTIPVTELGRRPWI